MKSRNAAGPPVRFSVDGKELRGSIQPGHTRGEVCVSAVAHEGQQVVGQAFYNGTKESERPTVSQLLNERHLCHQKITLDALHMIPLRLRSIHTAKGLYVVGLKANQANLYRQCICRTLFYTADYEQFDVIKKRHGRKEQRTYRCYSLGSLVLAPRWQTTGLATLIRVERHRQQGDIVSQEISYFVSNSLPSSQLQAAELFDAIRQHWSIEPGRRSGDASSTGCDTG